MKRLKSFILVAFVLTVTMAFSQTEKDVRYSITEIPSSNVPLIGSAQIRANNFKVYQLDIQSLKSQLVGIANREDLLKGFVANVKLPHPNGEIHTYRTVANSTLHPKLAAKYPSIKTYDAVGVENLASVKWDITGKGLHAMIMVPGESTIYIDPLVDGNTDYYIVYSKKDFTTDKVMDCSFNADLQKMVNKTEPVSGEVKAFGTCELRTYRLALAATGEYTTFHGGTVAQAQSAQATTMNRVNGVFERDMAITMVIIPNNDLIIYTNAASDPYANGNPGTMINQNQTNIDATIGNGNYDIGHVFGTNSGGLAGLGVVCNNANKARGVTGSGAPIGDPFDIDYVAHEMGHQFGANHTQNNNCNRNNPTAMEPGSASTIMGYAGICAPNVQSNSDDHFHGISLEEIGNEILSAGHTCEVITALANNAPIVMGTNGNVTVPANTPFALTASVIDADGDPLLYCWEQMDNAVSTQPPSPTSTDGPNFRSNSPILDSTRYFPNLADLAAGISPTWEVLPSVSRSMSFRVTVRDKDLNVPGCNDHEDVTVTFDGNSGPFVVLYPSATGIIWTGLTSETVTWDVANTDVAPVNCSSVDIFLSTDGGLTYPFTLATGVPNDGAETIAVPNVATTTARVMVMNSNGTFFDISDNNFEITMATYDFSQSVSPNDTSICQPNDANYVVSIGSVGGFADPVTLSVSGVPAGATSSFSVNPVTPVGTSTLNITNTASASPGIYTITISGTSTTGTKTTDVTLTISDGSPSPVTQITPADMATGVSVPTAFTWTTAPEIGVTYEIDIATDPGFATIVDQAMALPTPDYTSTVLLSNTTYYWRVRSVTGCGQSAWSAAFTFTTSNCNLLVSTDVGQVTNVASVTSTIVVTASGTITDVNLIDFDITHPWVGDLGASLTSPQGTVVQLFDGPGIPASTWGCANDDMLVTWDDAAALTATDLENMCNATAPTISGTFQSMDPMSNFNGESITGTWTLTIFDSYTQGDDGVLNGWGLELCTTPPVACNDPELPVLNANTVTICEGDSVVLSVTGGNLNDAIDWQWYTGSCGGTNVGSGTSLTVAPTTTTSYFVRGEGACVTPGACTQIDVLVNPVFAANETATVCEGDDYTYPDGFTTTNVTANETHVSNLTTTNGCDSIVTTTLTVDPIVNTSEAFDICEGEDYTYPDGFTSTNITVNESHVSTLTSTVTGCDSVVTTNLTVVTAFNTNESATICDGEVYTFPDGNTGTTTQVYTSTLTTAGGCDSIIVTNLTVTTVDVTVIENAPTLTANLFATSYQWLDCDNNYAPIPGATSQSFTPADTVGNYAVAITNNGCTDTSACYVVDQTGLAILDASGVIIYPNPTTGIVKVKWIEDVQSIEVTDARGRILLSSSASGIHETEIDLSSFTSGVYFIHMMNSSGRSVFDIIKH